MDLLDKCPACGTGLLDKHCRGVNANTTCTWQQCLNPKCNANVDVRKGIAARIEDKAHTRYWVRGTNDIWSKQYSLPKR